MKENKRAKKCPEINRERYTKMISDWLKNPCKLCWWDMIQSWRRKKKCVKCDTQRKAKWVRNLNKIFIDMSDPKNRKFSCDECWWIMDYYNFKYWCRKCWNILEV